MKIHVMTIPGWSDERDGVVDFYRTNYDACVHEDPERKGVLWNHANIVKCMLDDEYTGRSSWSLVVQDDVLPLEGWEDHYSQVKMYVPREAAFVSLSHFAGYGKKLVDRGIPFGLGMNNIWGQAVMYRQVHLPDYLNFVLDVMSMDYDRYQKWDDGLMSVFNMIYGTKSAYTARALFEHQDWTSTMGHVPGQWRHAYATIANTPIGPGWGSMPRHGGGGPGVEKVQKELFERITKWRSEQ